MSQGNILLVLLIGEIAIILLLKFGKKLKHTGPLGILETDLRLTYKRFRELYPHSTISYPAYKKLQTQKAYKKAVSSMELERMVR